MISSVLYPDGVGDDDSPSSVDAATSSDDGESPALEVLKVRHANVFRSNFFNIKDVSTHFLCVYARAKTQFLRVLFPGMHARLRKEKIYHAFVN